MGIETCGHKGSGLNPIQIVFLLLCCEPNPAGKGEQNGTAVTHRIPRSPLSRLRLLHITRHLKTRDPVAPLFLGMVHGMVGIALDVAYGGMVRHL